MKLITENELCEILQVGRVFVYNCRKNGMPFVRLGSRSIRYDFEKVLEWFLGLGSYDLNINNGVN